ncbi:MAG: Maf family protein [Spirochaetes bacterium]|nr:Maf family protein [Spirochaetota bacterium]
MDMEVVLASSSERRKEFFRHLFDKVYFVSPDVEENIRENKFKIDLLDLSFQKAKEGFIKFKNSCDFLPNKNYIVVGADTIVRVKGRILGKPNSDEQWKEYLSILSGAKQEVWTAVSILKNNVLKKKFIEVSYVWFRKLTDRDIDRYIKSGEGKDAAGGYKIQGWGIIFISKVKGSYTNIVGFPVEKFLKCYKSLKNNDLKI